MATEQFPNSTKFFVSETASEPSTRTASPAPLPGHNYVPNGRSDSSSKALPDAVAEASPGVLPDDVYESVLVWWRASARRLLVRSLRIESRWLASMQSWIRNDWLDTYFMYTSALGTHTFFMMLLPGLYFLGHEKIALGLITTLGMGGYCTSFLKDLVCVPRPFSPPVTRLSIGNHHLEYGFPSTHSANSASVALYFHTLVYRLYVSADISSTTLHLAQAVLAWYMFSIVFGRLYCGMHSFMDCLVGVLLGSAVSMTYFLSEKTIEHWLTTSGWAVPFTLMPLAFLMINQHPQPVDDCPCFEDAIAFVSSIMGAMLGKWHAALAGFDLHNFFSGISRESDWNTWTIWITFACLRLFFGVLSIFVWRLVAKALFHAILPPTFRFAAHIFTLPNRRFYTPATDYERVPVEKGLHPIPSVIDLSQAVIAETSATLPRTRGEGLKLRNGASSLKTAEKVSPPDNEYVYPVSENPGNGAFGGREGRRKHYDADVLTKVMVYTGIGMIAAEWGPALFEVLGWNMVT